MFYINCCKYTIPFLPLILLIACGQAGSPQPEKVENKPEVADPAPENPELKYLHYEFDNYHLFDLKDTIREDFNGDGAADEAVFTTRKDKAGILITDGKTGKTTQIGLGEPFEEMSDDFSWVDYWGVTKDSLTYEVIVDSTEVVGDSEIRLQHPAIFLRRYEVGGGLIAFRNGKFEWIHQAD